MILAPFTCHSQVRMKAAVLCLFLSAPLVSICGPNDAANILVLIPFNTKSHKNMFVPIIKALADRGHRLDVVSMFSSGELQNYTNVKDTVIKLGADVPSMGAHLGSTIFTSTSSHFFGFLSSFGHFEDMCEYLMALPQVQNLFRHVAATRYKIVLLDAFMCECFLSLVHLADAPLVQVAPSHLMPWNYAAIGESVNYAKDAVFFLPHTDRKTLVERAQAAFMGTTAHLIRDLHYLPRIQEIVAKAARKILGKRRAKSIPAIWDIERERTALVLVNWHWSLGAFVRSNPPNLVQVGTMHCREPNPLPQELDEFIGKSGDDGFILFSLGSTIPGHSMPIDLQKKFLEAFSQLPQRVLWKFEKQMEVPENVLVTPWLPQQDLLGDPRLKVFVTQAGMLSVQEAAWHAAPLLVAPLIVDQRANAATAAEAGLGLQIDLHSATPELIKRLISQIVNNSSFREAAVGVSRRVRDQPQSGGARAAWWVEYVIRHRGGAHLRPHPPHWTQHYLLDVAAATGLALLFLAAFKAAYGSLRAKKKTE